jgi:L-rhamnose mutarotase
MKEFALHLELKNDPDLITQYEHYHRDVWPQVIEAIRHVGILNMKIYRWGNRIFMIMQTSDDYDMQQAANYLNSDPVSIEWEQLMDKFQQRLPGTLLEQKWQLMSRCFDLQHYI